MFGYVTVCKEHMTEDDFKLFNSYYCGLCKATGKCCSQVARLGLSYDITFLAMVIDSVTDGDNITGHGGCIAHPFKDKPYICNNKSIDYAACMGTLLTYLKFKDDVYDDKSIKAMVLSSLFHGGVKKSNEKYKKEYDKIVCCLKELSHLEKENCAETDRCADCFAKILELLFTPDFIENDDTRRILAWIGYNTGRWIYVIDAYNDMERDFKKKSFNPFLAEEYGDFTEHRKKIKEQLEVSLTFNLENIASAFELLKTNKNRSVIEHIIYCGLKVKQNMILGENNESL